MRPETEIVAMRDKLERQNLYAEHPRARFNEDPLIVLRWVCDPSVGDREILDLADGSGATAAY